MTRRTNAQGTTRVIILIIIVIGYRPLRVPVIKAWCFHSARLVDMMSRALVVCSLAIRVNIGVILQEEL